MGNIIYKSGIVFNEEDIRALYDDAGWYAYTKDIKRLMAGIKNSLRIISAWDNNNLIGLIRVVGDGETILYIQDILVLKVYKRMGIGTELVTRILDSYKEVRQKVLLTDDTPTTRSFYSSLGFHSSDNVKLVSFVKLD